MNRPILLAILFLLGTAGCANLTFLPAEAALTLNHPTHVEAYRTGALDAHPGYGGKLDGFAVFGTGQISPAIAQNLAVIIADAATYRDQEQPGDFIPNVGYRFYRGIDGGRGQASLDVLISFDADEVLLVARDSKLREDFRRLFSSDPGRQRLLDLTRQAFPSDPWVQSVPDLVLPGH